MTSEPDTMWKQAYFHNAIKNFKPLSHDLAVYDRTPEGEPNRSYEFLMKAARDYLEKKRLEKMRQATKKSVSGKRDAAPAHNRPPSAGKPQGICYDFQAGMYKAHQVQVHAVVARSTFRSQNVQNTRGSDHFWRLRCRKSGRRCGAKHISKSKC